MHEALRRADLISIPKNQDRLLEMHKCGAVDGNFAVSSFWQLFPQNLHLNRESLTL